MYLSYHVLKCSLIVVLSRWLSNSFSLSILWAPSMLIYSFYFATLCHFLPYFSQDVPHPSPFTCPSFSSNVAYCDSCSLFSISPNCLLLSLSLPLVLLHKPPSPVHSRPPTLSTSLTPLFPPFSPVIPAFLPLPFLPSVLSLLSSVAFCQLLSPSLSLPLPATVSRAPSLPIFLPIPHLIFLCLTMYLHVPISAPLYFSIYTLLSIFSFWV